MKVILTQDVRNQGKKGDIINPYNTPDAIITFSKNFKELVK